ncbi:MAG: two-component system response regulator [Desulfuromonas sp.]|nr:MAG: two-component system response regulator [Desulfuromonas sp.]
MARKILTVDDSATVRQLLNMTLTDAGYDVTEAADGKQALSLVAENQFDMLVTDLNMPEIDGIKLIEEVRKIPGNRFMPIIMLTTESHEGVRKKGKIAGASGWIVKPFRPEQVLGVVRMVMP